MMVLSFVTSFPKKAISDYLKDLCLTLLGFESI